jgi:hypothetical protein
MKQCCNDECNQGRDCPAQVARIGCSYPKEDDYSDEYDEYLQLIAKIALVFTLLVIFGFIGILMLIVS